MRLQLPSTPYVSAPATQRSRPHRSASLVTPSSRAVKPPFERIGRLHRCGRLLLNVLDTAASERDAQEVALAGDMEETTSDARLSSCRCLVLDLACRPVGILGWKRAICLDLLEKVEVLEYHDVCVRSVSRKHPIPAVLRAQAILKPSQTSSVPLNRANVIFRDEGKCVYCGSSTRLTMDHVVPLCKGGRKTWENVVTACYRCNNKKGSRTLKQLGWKLKTVPKHPSPFDIRFLLIHEVGRESPKQWEDYLPGLRDFRI